MASTMSGVNYFFALTTIISPGQREFLCSSEAAWGARLRARAKARPADRVLCFSRKRIRGGGKMENLLLGFHFPVRLVAGAVEMWESRLPSARFPRGSWKEGEACFWLSTLSTAPAFP